MALAQKLDSSSLETTVQQQPYLQTSTAGQAAAAELAMEEVDYESLPTERLSAHLCAGAAAGMMEHCAMYPVDCVKTRMMALNPDPQARYRSLTQAFYRIVTQENPRALFRGMGAVASGAGPAHAIYFACYEFSKKFLSNGNRSTVLSQGAAGAISSLLHDAFMNPIDVMKQRLQMYNSPYRGAIHCARTVYQSEGLRAFYRSYTTQVSMNVPFQVTHFVGYEFLQDRLNYERKYDPLSHMLSGAGAGAFASIITNPLDVAKTLLNTRLQHKQLANEQRIVGMVNAMITIYKTTGIRGYYRGVTARVLYQMPSTAICWSVYEFFKHALRLKSQEEGSPSSNQPPS